MSRSKLGLLISIVGVVFAVASVWWWALFGVKPDVGTALAVTSLAFFSIGIMTFLSGIDL